MLGTMLDNTAAVSTSASAQLPSSFASLLAGLAATAAADKSGSEDGLEDDIATISYERALRAHARTPVAASAHSEKRKPPVSLDGPARKRENAAPRASRKAASVTVRLSAEEAAQLQERAAAAGLTASAYLRSCLFEAETLRAQVKEALEQFRTATTPAQAKTPEHVADPALAHEKRRWWKPVRWLSEPHARTA
jgi:hypothetical protein